MRGWMLKRMIVILIISSLCWGGGCYQAQALRSQSEKSTLVVHVDSIMQPLIEKLAALYEKESGQTVELNVGDSQTLLAQITKTNSGDLFISYDLFMDILMLKEQIGVDGWTVSQLVPCLMVQKDNPKHIYGLRDVARADVRLWLPAAGGSPLGRMVPTLFEKVGIDFDELSREKEMQTYDTMTTVAEQLRSGRADVAVVWWPVAKSHAEATDLVRIDDDYLPVANVDAITSASGRLKILMPVAVTISTLQCSTQPKAAQALSHFLISDKVEQVFRDYGFELDVEKNYQEGQFL